MRPTRASARSRLVTAAGAGALTLIGLSAVAFTLGAAWPVVAPTVAVAARSAANVAVVSLVAPDDDPDAPQAARPAPQERTAVVPSADATPRPRPSPSSADRLGPSAPERLQIDAIGVDTDLVGLGLQDDGTMQVPAAGFPAGWYRGAPTPGEIGPAVIVGHVDWAGAPGVFADLGKLDAGDEVAVTRADGTTAVFTVTDVLRVAKHAFPTVAVYGDLDHAGLRLITCGGVFDQGASSYEDNVIAFAELDRVTGDGPDSSSVGAPPS